MRAPSLLAMLALCAAAIGCSEEPAWSTNVPSPSRALFESTAYPILLRDCGFSECHGGEHRFFRIFGPGRARLDPLLTLQGDPPTPAEIELSYQRTRSMLAMSERVQDSLLLRKPLEIEAGGQGHEGVDELGRNVYRSAADPRYVTLLRWASSVSDVAAQPPVGTP